jgi:hypothetical protein
MAIYHKIANKINYILGLVPDSPKIMDLSQPKATTTVVAQSEQKTVKNLEKSKNIIHIKHIE